MYVRDNASLGIRMTRLQNLGSDVATSPERAFAAGRRLYQLRQEAPRFVTAVEVTPPRPTLQEEAERLLFYWEQHGNNPAVVEKWAVSDLLGIARYIVEEGK